jgi:hypothetical protein
VAYLDGAAVRNWADGTVVLVGPNGDRRDAIKGRGPAVSADGTEVALFELLTSRVGILPARSEGDPLWAPVPKGEHLEPVGFLGTGDLVSNATNVDGENLGIRRHVRDGSDLVATETGWELEAVTAVSEAAGLVAGYSEFTEDGTCSAVYEASGRRPLWQTCDYSFDHFSPDGRLLIGDPAYRDGVGDSFAVVVDAATGDVVRKFSVESVRAAGGGTGHRGFIADTAFEDDSHVLLHLNMYTEGDPGTRQALVRCDIEGRCELATPVATLEEGQDAYSLGAQP